MQFGGSWAPQLACASCEKPPSRVPVSPGGWPGLWGICAVAWLAATLTCGALHVAACRYLGGNDDINTAFRAKNRCAAGCHGTKHTKRTKTRF